MEPTLRDYQIEKSMQAGIAQASRPMTLVEKLTARKQDFEACLADVNTALAALEANPDVTKAMEAINKVNRLM